MGASCGGYSRKIYDKAPENEIAAYVDYSGPGPWFTCDPTAIMAPRLAVLGVASKEVIEPTTLPLLFKRAAQMKGSYNALCVERPVPPQDAGDGKPAPALPLEEWTKWTWKAYYDETVLVAKALLKVGMKQFQTVNIWGFNAPEWNFGALAPMFIGGKCAGIYPTDTPDAAAYKVVHSGGAAVFVEDEGKIKKLVPALNDRGDCKDLLVFVVWGQPPESPSVKVCNKAIPVLSYQSFKEKGADVSDKDLEARIQQVNPGHCAALIYTSGTTGDPKAVMLSHDSYIFEATNVGKILIHSVGYGETGEERVLSYLPMSHVAGLMVDVMAPMAGCVYSKGAGTVFYARPYDLKAGTIKDRLCVAKPTLFLGVPLVWEKIADKIRAIGATTTGLKKTIAITAKDMGLAHAKACQMGGSGEYPTGYGIADAVVLKKIKATLGLDECKFGFTGAAPMRTDTLEFFGSLGMQIKEVYGMSECCGASTWSTDECHAWGSCGYEMPAQELKAFIVDPTDINKKTECPRSPALDCQEEQYQGELCYRGRNIMMGYMANSALGTDHVEEIRKKTMESIDKDGWLHSGDKGMVTKAGMVKITGRYKELIIGEGGENIAPVPIEDCVKKTCDGIAEIMMIGDKRKYNVALVTLKAVGANGENPGTDDLDAGAKRVNANCTTISAAMDDEVWIKTITEAIESTNKNGKVCPNNTFKIQKFMILPHNFSEDGGELTPTKKLKRKNVENKYAKQIEKLYSSSGCYIRYSE